MSVKCDERSFKMFLFLTDKVACEYRRLLEGDDPGGGAFALFLRPHPGAFTQLMCPHPGEFAYSFKKMLMPGG